MAALVLQFVGVFPSSFYWREFQGSYPFSIVITLAVGLTLTTYQTLRHQLQSATLQLRTKQVEQERAYKLLAEARLSSLESRLHPHFLFNTLNSIAALIPRDPQRAEDTVGKLASLLRFSLATSQSGFVTLAQELKFVRDYLEIESTRFGARLQYEIDVPDALMELKTPPMALQSLVENAVKHVVA
jgi:LytS/YehU family sensor histidine kinase